MSHWGWHSFPLPEGVKAGELPETGCYMKGYPKDGVDRVPADKKIEGSYIFSNPHPLNFARIRFVKANGEELALEELIHTDFCLDLYEGVTKTSFLYQDSPVTVTVFAFSDRDGIAARVETEKGRKDLAVEIAFPYPDLECREWIGDFHAEDRHHTAFHFSDRDQACFIERTVDTTAYSVQCKCRGGSFGQSGAHCLKLNLSESGTTEFSVLFYKENAVLEELPVDFAGNRQKTAQHWQAFWENGGAIDLSESEDDRWFELERRIVLSQYLLAVQSAGSYPCAEAGLMNLDSWHGQFHMEMIWWHAAHYALWGRMEMADQQLSCYRKFLPVAEKLAKQLGKKGAKWGKQVGPEGRTAPWSGNLALFWKQPHPIFFAELEYRNRPNAETLRKWDEIICKTAEHMVDCAVKKEDGCYHLENVMPPSELGFTLDTVFDLAYWRWALEIAGKWQERLGKKRVAEWDEVMNGLAPLPVKDGLYIRSAEWTHTYEDPNQTHEHPDPVGVYGMLPLTDHVDAGIVKNSLKKIWEVWQKDRIWGWDFAWISMCASRVEEPEIAVDSMLLMEVDEMGTNKNGSDPYLPANGGILYAAAMMCVGKNGEHAPGFPKNGQWIVKCEGIMGW